MKGRIAQLGMAMLAVLMLPGLANAAIRASESLQWQYDMTADPATQDLDGDSNPDWETNFTSTPSVGVLPMTTGNHLQMLGGTELWSTANGGAGITGDYTVETKLQIGTTVPEGSNGTTMITADPAGSSWMASWLRLKRTGQSWGVYTETGIGGADDNTDTFHTFRVALKGSSYFVWRDGVGLRDSSGNGAMANAANGSSWNLDRLKIGNGNSTYQGAYDVDYVYIDDAAYSPVVAELADGVTCKYDFDVDPSTQDLDEDGFGFNLDWQKAGTVGLSGGIASMGDGDNYTSGYTVDSDIWKTGNFDADYAIEASVKVDTVTSGMLGAMGITADLNGSTGLTDTAWLNVDDDGQSWGLGGGYGPLISLGTADNTDGFHIFRIMYQVDEGFFVYRDGVLLNPGGVALTDATPSSPGYQRVRIGDLGSVHGGTFQMDYMSLTKVPEPSAILLLVAGGLTMLIWRKRRTG